MAEQRQQKISKPGAVAPLFMRLGKLLPIPLLLVAARTSPGGEYRLDSGEKLQAAVDRLKPGDTLIVPAGVRRESVTISGLNGTAMEPIVIRGETGAVVRATERDGILFWGKPSSHVIVENLRVEGGRRAGIIVSGSSNITIRKCVVADNGKWGVQTSSSDSVTIEDCELCGSREQHGVYFSTTAHPVVRRCRIHDNAACGIHNNGDLSEGGDGVITGAILEDNRIYGNGRLGGAAINMDGVESSVARNNLIRDNLAGGITLFHVDGRETGSSNRIERNTISFRAGQGRFALQIVGGGRANVVRNNILSCGRGPALDVDRLSTVGLVSDGNALFSAGKTLVGIGDQSLSLKQWQGEFRQDAHSVLLPDGAVTTVPGIGCGKGLE
jgi:parallel beta-helix repeat protein